MLVYLPMLLAVSFHHHDDRSEAESAVYCYDCAHHIHHDGHFVGGHSVHDCALCVLQSLTYTVPSIVIVATFVAVMCIVYAASCSYVNRLRDNVLSTRAPPAPCF